MPKGVRKMKISRDFILKNMSNDQAILVVESVLSIIKEKNDKVLLNCKGDYFNETIWVPKNCIIDDEHEIVYVRDVIRRLGFRHRADIKCIIYQNGKKRKERNCCCVMDNMSFIQAYDVKEYKMLDDKTLRIDLIDVAPSKRYGTKNEDK